MVKFAFLIDFLFDTCNHRCVMLNNLLQEHFDSFQMWTNDIALVLNVTQKTRSPSKEVAAAEELSNITVVRMHSEFIAMQTPLDIAAVRLSYARADR